MTTPANPDDLIAFVHQQLENQRLRAGALKTLAHAMPAAETGAYLTETANLLLADVDAKRRILDRHRPIELFHSMYCTYCGVLGGQRARDVNWPCPEILDAAAPYADRHGYRSEWAPA